MPAGSELKRLKTEYPGIEIETVEVTSHPVRAWKDGVKIFPAMTLTGYVLIECSMAIAANTDISGARLYRRPVDVIVGLSQGVSILSCLVLAGTLNHTHSFS